MVSGTLHSPHAPPAVQVRCLDVLLGVLAHDPSLVRRAVLGQLLEAKSVAHLTLTLTLTPPPTLPLTLPLTLPSL